LSKGAGSPLSRAPFPIFQVFHVPFPSSCGFENHKAIQLPFPKLLKTKIIPLPVDLYRK